MGSENRISLPASCSIVKRTETPIAIVVNVTWVEVSEPLTLTVILPAPNVLLIAVWMMMRNTSVWEAASTRIWANDIPLVGNVIISVVAPVPSSKVIFNWTSSVASSVMSIGKLMMDANVSSGLVTSCANLPPIVTVAPSWKFDPLMVISVPPMTYP